MRSLIGYSRTMFSGLRFRLLLLLLVACAPLMALTLHSALKDRRAAKVNWQAKFTELFREVRRDEEQFLKETDQLLRAIGEDSGVLSMHPQAAKASLERFRTETRFWNVGVLMTNGEVLASLRPVRRPLQNMASFRTATASGKFAFTRFPLPRSNTNAIVHFFQPIRQQDRTLAVVFAERNLATQPLSSRPRSLLSQRENADAIWMEIDSRGKIIACYPPQSERRIGLYLPDTWLMTNLFAQRSGVLEAPGSRRTGMFYAFQTSPSRLALQGTTVAYVLGQPTRVLFASADLVMWQHLTALAIAVSIALALGWIGSKLLILRPVEALARSSARLAEGDLTVRTGLPPSRDELGQLTIAFDRMAEALQQRELDRQRASHKLQLLSHKLVEVQESERRHLARELHDEIGQSLTAAEMNLQAALQLRGSEALGRRLEDSIQAVERVLEQVHDLSLNLRPSMLDDLGLEPALRWYTQRQAALTGLHAEFRADISEERLDPLVETECFRVAQEALTNVVRHAHAHGVTVELTKRNGHLHLCVRDDGVGFDVAGQREKAIRGASLGLLSMDERASLAGGGLELRSIAGQGTEVHAWFPLKLKESAPLSQLNE